MENTNLPEPFYSYWKIKKPLPDERSFTKNNDRLSNEWNNLIKAVKQAVEKDLQKD